MNIREAVEQLRSVRVFLDRSVDVALLRRLMTEATHSPSDLGMFLQTLMLLLLRRRAGRCAQECWVLYPQTLGQLLNPPADHILFCGMVIGYAGNEHPVNRLVSDRAPLNEIAAFHGI